MGPISRVNARPIDPYLQWRERMEEKKAEKEKYAGSQDLKTSKTEKESGFAKGAGNVPGQRIRDEYVPGPDRTPESGKLPESGEEPDKAAKKADGMEPDKAAKKADGKKTERYMGSTDKVDREIEKLKKRKSELEGQLRMEQDESKVQSLERELAQVERELSQKDNDGYRRRHMVMTEM